LHTSDPSSTFWELRRETLIGSATDAASQHPLMFPLIKHTMDIYWHKGCSTLFFICSNPKLLTQASFVLKICPKSFGKGWEKADVR